MTLFSIENILHETGIEPVPRQTVKLPRKACGSLKIMHSVALALYSLAVLKLVNVHYIDLSFVKKCQ